VRQHSRMFRVPTLKYWFDEQRDSNIIGYSFPDIGDYNMHVFLDGEDIVGSPFHVICKPQLTRATKEVDQCFPRLLRFSGKGQKVNASLVALKPTSLNMNDVFVLDNWNCAYQWNPSGAVFLGTKALTILQATNDSRSISVGVKVIDNAWNANDPDVKNFWRLLGVEQIPNQSQLTNNTPNTFEPTLYRVESGPSGPKFTKVGSGPELKKSKLITPNTVMLLDTGFDLHIWDDKDKGKPAGDTPRTPRGGSLASQAPEAYIQQFSRPELLKVTKVMPGRESSLVKHFLVI